MESTTRGWGLAANAPGGQGAFRKETGIRAQATNRAEACAAGWDVHRQRAGEGTEVGHEGRPQKAPKRQRLGTVTSTAAQEAEMLRDNINAAETARRGVVQEQEPVDTTPGPVLESGIRWWATAAQAAKGTRGRALLGNLLRIDMDKFESKHWTKKCVRPPTPAPVLPAVYRARAPVRPGSPVLLLLAAGCTAARPVPPVRPWPRACTPPTR